MKFRKFSMKDGSHIHYGVLILKMMYLQGILLVPSVNAESNNLFLLKDDCAQYDTCKARSFFRTCNCDDDCYLYRTCCFDAPNFNLMKSDADDFYCHSDKISQAVFFKQTCSAEFGGDDRIRTSCQNAGSDTSDLVASVPVSSSRTNISYPNWNCGICNGEDHMDLAFWTVTASCPVGKRHKRFDADLFRKTFVYDKGIGEWGIHDEGEFMPCPVHLFEPTFLTGRLKTCTLDLVSSCPDNWNDEATRENCRTFYGERQLKAKDVYYRNAYCAICNGKTLDNLICFGQNRRRNPSGDLNSMRITFNLNTKFGEYTEGQPKCSGKEKYDPFLRKCRRFSCGHVEAKRAHALCAESKSHTMLPSVISLLCLFVGRLVHMRFLV